MSDLSEVLTFRVTPEEARQIRAKARSVRLSVSAYLRLAACAECERQRLLGTDGSRSIGQSINYNASTGVVS